MFRKLVCFVVFFLFAVPLYAAENYKVVETVASSDSATAISVPLTNTIRTKSISMRQQSNTESMGIMYKAFSPGTVTLKIELEQGYDKPATEGVYDLNYITTDTVDASLTTTLWQLATIETVVTPYVRFKLTGSGSNDAGTTIQLKVIK